MTLGSQLLVLAKEPVPGRVKTRLGPVFTPVQAAQLAAAALADTLAAVAATPVARRVIVLEGVAGRWLPGGMEVLIQRGDGLDERLAAAFTDAAAGSALPMLLVGMDTPQVTPAQLTAAVRALLSDSVDAVLGRAADGGWWALGLRRADPALLLGVPMSTPHTGAAQRARLDAARLRVIELPVLRDVDTPADARCVARTAPSSRFAAAFAELACAPQCAPQPAPHPRFSRSA